MKNKKLLILALIVDILLLLISLTLLMLSKNVVWGFAVYVWFYGLFAIMILYYEEGSCRYY